MFSTAANAKDDAVPLCVDLDGTLVRTDMLWESVAQLLKRRPFDLVMLPFWLLKGRAHLKRQIAARTDVDPAHLPYHHEFMDFLRAESGKGRALILATASDDGPAQRIAKHVGLFREVVASNGTTNLRGSNKGRLLSEKFGKGGFDYAGNSSVDFAVWSEARQAIVVNAGDGVTRQAGKLAEVSRVFNPRGDGLRSVLKELRPHQWVKNFIIFVPLVTSHRFVETALVLKAVLAFIAFSLCASGVYVLNDVLDLEADRQHETKKRRPLASGDLPLSAGLCMIPALFGLGAVTAAFLPWSFAAVLTVYVLLTTSYSWRLKRIVLLDVFVLAGLYTIRLIAGHEATKIEYSFWLLAFSMFIFLSLALLKRYTELAAMRQLNKQETAGRGYVAGDLELVAMLGIGSGFLAVLVMALYVRSPEINIQQLYQNPMLLLLMCPLLMFWVSRVWLLAHRGQMHDDPVVFALKDRVSYVIGALALVVLWLATGRF
jgi:4-hydroxybenzoate polyprenyltransferase